MYVIPFNGVSSYSPYGLLNASLYFLTLVKQYLIEHKQQMETQELLDVYIREKDGISVMFILKPDCKPDYDYWEKTVEEVREYGAEFVSVFLKDDPLLKIGGGLTKFNFLL